MPSIDEELAKSLRQSLSLERAVETGSYLGEGARRLAASFAQVITIELSEEFAGKARANLCDVPHAEVVQGHSAKVLGRLPKGVPTLWFLDGHWSGGATAGAEDECPVLEELAAIAGGSPDDVVVIDDARLFAAAPPPPHDPKQWPELVAVMDRLRELWPQHHVTLLNDQVVAVPRRAKAALDAYAHRLWENPTSPPSARPGRTERLLRWARAR